VDETCQRHSWLASVFFYVEIWLKIVILWNSKSWRDFEWRAAIFLAEWMVSAEAKSWRDSVLAWRDFWIRMLYLGSYVWTVARFSLARRDFACHCVLFKCFTSDFWGELLERETWIAKEETLGLSVFVERFSWVGKHCNHLVSENHWVTCSFVRLEKWVEIRFLFFVSYYANFL